MIHAVSARCIAFVMSALLALLALWSGSALGADDASRPLHVVSTTTILADMVRQLGGGRVESRCLLAPGVDAHTYQPTPDDVRLIASAQVMVVNGLGLEGWLDQVIAAGGATRMVTVASNGVEPLRSGGGIDPHAWQDAHNGMIYARNIRDALIAADPAGKDDYSAWADAYLAELRVIDAWIKKQIAALPASDRVLVTSHDALAYFGKAYGLEVHPVEGVTTGQEPDAARIAALIALLKERRVKAVFIERGANPKMVERIGGDGGARLGGELFSDSLDAAERPAGTYLGMFLANTRALVQGLR